MIGSSSCVRLGVVGKGLKNARELDRGYLCVSSSGVVRLLISVVDARTRPTPTRPTARASGGWQCVSKRCAAPNDAKQPNQPREIRCAHAWRSVQRPAFAGFF
jgi:hypothetical protein